MLQQTQTQEPTLTQEQLQELRTRLGVYQLLKVDLDALETHVAAEKQAIFTALQDAGIEKTVIDGILCSIVTGNTSYFDKLRFVELGGNLSLVERATSKKPKAPYVKITLAKDGEP